MVSITRACLLTLTEITVCADMQPPVSLCTACHSLFAKSTRRMGTRQTYPCAEVPHSFAFVANEWALRTARVTRRGELGSAPADLERPTHSQPNVNVWDTRPSAAQNWDTGKGGSRSGSVNTPTVLAAASTHVLKSTTWCTPRPGPAAASAS